MRTSNQTTSPQELLLTITLPQPGQKEAEPCEAWAPNGFGTAIVCEGTFAGWIGRSRSFPHRTLQGITA
ncbi:MAG: hypothetical protein R3C19_01530 [Planctomycetaceae bacterium]